MRNRSHATALLVNLAATRVATTLEAGTGKEEMAMQLQSGTCYLLWSEQIVKLRDRLDENRWMAKIWDRAECEWSLAVYAIDEQLIDSVICDPQSLRQRSIG